MVEVGTSPVCLGPEYIRDMEAFTDWMDKTHRRAMLETPLVAGTPLEGKEFHKFVANHVGYLREYYTHNGCNDCCEYWAPLDTVDEILGLKTRETVVVDRRMLAQWLLHAVRIEDGVQSDQYAFQLLEMQHQGQALYYWRVNQPKGKFLLCSHPQRQKDLDDRRRLQRQQRARDYQANQAQTSGWRPYKPGGRGGATSDSWDRYGHHGSNNWYSSDYGKNKSWDS